MATNLTPTQEHVTPLHCFFDAATKYPERIAVKDCAKSVCYRDLKNQIINIGNYLRGQDIKTGDLIAVEFFPSVELIAALLAVQSVGAAYVPIDKKAPRERNQLILDDAQPALIISDTQTSLHPGFRSKDISDIINAKPTENSHDESTPDGIAYVIYTSGTTGRPKGVPVSHQSLRTLFAATDGLYHFSEKDVVLMYHSYAFDFSVWEIWSALAYGATLLIPDEETRVMPEKLARLIKHERVTILNQTPTAFSINAEKLCQLNPWELSLRFIIFGGERLNFQTLKNWNHHFGLSSPLLVNMYGITETTVHASWHIINESDLKRSESNIGKILPGFYYIIRPLGDHEWPDNSGELLLSGPQVTCGYLNIDNEESGKFVWLENDGVSHRYYCSGDIVQHNANNDLIYLGRSDQQVKIHGYRIEIGEIESVLAQMESINDISVIATHSELHGHHLVCFFTSTTPAAEIIEKLKSMAKKLLPVYMRPALYRKIDIMPKTVNGKVDKKNIIYSLTGATYEHH
ncbi:hypothetical protein CWC46_17740 [Prodigiosinella confusarubida]|uniref:Peptide synthetase n=1 Tax=Serratia sp. (strain ATCC 39006) TaxID=104623 RepID=A0A2I5TMM2_SERS3|nr:amino acid adenylation domain-containing protein [Serratia sp. ATCC 39006]AUH01487.1 hypothetical protein CWC46_17740 [Serratia sp. ATCC 39006]AUH05810.1 hypothetical protein Ser39006_017740 [Serratia sp. ATCC 39006]